MSTTRTTDGFSYVEVLLAASLIAAALVPAMESIAAALDRARQAEAAVADRHDLRARMETVLAEPWGNLLTAAAAAGDATTETSYSDAPGTPRRRVVFIARYDGDADPFVVADPDLDGDANPFSGYLGVLWIRTAGAADPRALETLRAP